jgi:dienelactone hydrolase
MLLILLLLSAAEPTLAERLSDFAATLRQPDAVANEAAWLREQIAAGNRRSSADWGKLRSKADWQAYRAKILAALNSSLGSSTPAEEANLRIRGTIEHNGCKIHRITYESIPGLVVTANLYEPATPSESMPGMILVHSHHNPKTEGELQDMGQMGARAGCIVLVPDLLGHGERRQHPFARADDFPKSFRVGRQDYYFRHPVAFGLQVRGESLMGAMVRELRQGVNILLNRKGIDSKRIAILGAVAGGGDPAAVTAALDERITTAVIFNFGGPQPETRYPLPEDAETAFNYAGGGSWETTRNLAGSVSGGYLPWAIVGSLAPRQLVYAHEFSWDRERDPVWKRLQTIWKWHEAEANLRFTHGTGLLSGRPPEASHCNNIGPVHRKNIHAALNAWWGIDSRELEKPNRLRTAQLQCLDAEEPIAPIREVGQPAPTLAPRERLWANWRERLGVAEKAAPLKAEWTLSKPISTNKTYSLILDQDTGAAVTLFLPEAKRPPLTVLFGQGGATLLLRLRAQEIADKLDAGEAVALVDLGGTAQMPPGEGRTRTSAATSHAATALMLGRPLLGRRFDTLRQALAALRQREELRQSKITLWGDSPVPPNREAAVVPLDVALPSHAEPLGPHLALLMALADPEVSAVRCSGGLGRWASLSASPSIYLPYDALVPGALVAGDWPAVVASLPRCSVRLEKIIDSHNRLIPLPELKRLFGGKHVTLAEQ